MSWFACGRERLSLHAREIPLQVVIAAGRKAHLYLGGALCGVEDVAGSFAPFSAWHHVRPRMRCRKCSLRWEQMKPMIESLQGLPSTFRRRPNAK